MKPWILVALVACGEHLEPAVGSSPDAMTSVSSDAAAQVLYPDPDWTVGTPESVGLDPTKLDEAATAADANDSYCLLVIRHGVLVSEHYFHDATAQTLPSSWSIAKSYTSTIVGISGLDLDAPAMTYLPTWANDTRATITLRELVTMTSGLAWSIFNDYIAMAELAPDKSAFAIGLDAHVPAGSAWTYHNGGVQVIEPLFRAAMGTPIDLYAQSHLWGPIGMTATWDHDAAGHPTTFANVRATCRDHARLGYLYLHGGKWKDTQVVPAEWVAAATTPSQTYNRGYGYLFWLNGEGPTISSTGSVRPSELYDYAPSDLFAARGFGGQFIDVIPSLDMVVVRFGRDPATLTSTNPIEIAETLYEDETSDVHRAITSPIFAAAL